MTTWTSSPEALPRQIAAELAAINLAINQVRTDLALGPGFLPVASARPVSTWAQGTDRLPGLNVYLNGSPETESQIYTCRDLVLPLTLDLRYQLHDHSLSELHGHAYARALIGYLDYQQHHGSYPGIWHLEAERGGVELEDEDNKIYLTVVEAEARLRVTRRI